METPDEQNDEIRERVEREMPTPRNGFETDEQADSHKAAHEKRFFESAHCDGILAAMAEQESRPLPSKVIDAYERLKSK